MNYQNHLKTQAEWILEKANLSNLRGVIGRWNNQNQTVCLTFYFNGEPSEEDKEEASVACTEIIATFSTGFLKEKYLRLDYPQPLPESENWVYRRKEQWEAAEG